MIHQIQSQKCVVIDSNVPGPGSCAQRLEVRCLDREVPVGQCCVRPPRSRAGELDARDTGVVAEDGSCGRDPVVHHSIVAPLMPAGHLHCTRHQDGCQRG